MRTGRRRSCRLSVSQWSRLEKDERELEEAIGKVMRDGIVPDLLDGLTNTKEHLEALASMIGTVLNRHFIVLERLGYDLDNPPPDAKLNWSFHKARGGSRLAPRNSMYRPIRSTGQ
jgi:hypothetical protein